MKIGILTFHFSDNVGALLQAYGLRHYLRGLGHDADFVNYHPHHVEGGGQFRFDFTKEALKSNAKILYLSVSALRQNLFGSKRTKQAMADFKRLELGVVGDCVHEADAVPQLTEHHDLLICGSDQIWNPSEQFGVDAIYFLHFPTNATRKISYAPSFGAATLERKYRDEVSKYLNGLDGVSVREESAREIVRDLTGKDPTCVPDPTFLIDDYKELLVGKKNDPKGIFAYILRSGHGIQPMCDVLVSKFGSVIKSGWNPYRRWKDVGEVVEGGPIEWLDGINGAEFVITNSFHGTVFSLLLNRPFIAVRLPGAKAKLSARLENLLDKVGLRDRLVDAGDVARCREVMNMPIDWKPVNDKISELRTEGRNFLNLEIERLKESNGSRADTPSEVI